MKPIGTSDAVRLHSVVTQFREHSVCESISVREVCQGAGGLFINVCMFEVKSFGIRPTVSALLLMVAEGSHLLPVFLSCHFPFHPFCQQ